MEHGGGFLSWLNESDEDNQLLYVLARNLENFLRCRIATPDDALQFWKVIPEVRRACNEPATYELPWAAEAYAYVHLLERYRRTWVVLKHLTALAVLPIGSQGVRILDIGTGPAPFLYAADDFYASMSKYANTSGAHELVIPPPTLDCVERSPSMARFMHHFSEACGRRGPFGPRFTDLSGLDFAVERETYRKSLEYESYWDPETEEYEDYYDPQYANETANRLFRYKLVAFCNFLTLEERVTALRHDIAKLLKDLNTGAIVVILGGTGDFYQSIYKQVAAIAAQSGLCQANWDSDNLGDSIRNEAADRIIKASQYKVYQHLVELVGGSALDRSSERPDYWNSEPSPRARSRFALRVFRRGRWPTSSLKETTNAPNAPL